MGASVDSRYHSTRPLPPRVTDPFKEIVGLQRELAVCYIVCTM